ncbi:maleylpyruvate isomerase N-terminal domain-containing protein [Streptomyces sclerotialus]|uniref:maleylpyruvate isomerase N-terminal domain-containing protein n=1 Tax=Streptomyces sclerotialus TaxID=1957 RepID=UPI0004CC007C
MSHSTGTPVGPVIAADVEQAVRLAVSTLRSAVAADWSVPAGSLEWDCWETAEHLADDHFAYAAQLSPDVPPVDTHVPFRWTQARPGGPGNAFFADRAAGPAGLLGLLEASGGILAAVVRTASPDKRAYHVFGVSDPEGFAAMGVVETLVHTHDIAEGLGLAFTPPEDLCGRVLARLFPDAPDGPDRWSALLWCTGRTELPGRPRLTKWRWYGAPR